MVDIRMLRGEVGGEAIGGVEEWKHAVEYESEEIVRTKNRDHTFSTAY